MAIGAFGGGCHSCFHTAFAGLTEHSAFAVHWLAAVEQTLRAGHVLGYGNASDAHHFTAPHPEGRGLAFSIGSALDQAGLTAADMAFVNAHGLEDSIKLL